PGPVQIPGPRPLPAGPAANQPRTDRSAAGRDVGRDLIAAADAADALVIGPGIGQSPDAKARVMRLIRIDKPAVIDADALNLLAAEKRWPSFVKAKAVLTPHPGEMKRLAKLLGVTQIPTDDQGRSGL